MKEPSRSRLADSYRPEGTNRLKSAETLNTRPSTVPSQPDSPEQSRSGRDPSLSFLKRLEHYITSVFKLGRIKRMAKHAAREIDTQAGQIAELKAKNTRLEAAVDAAGDRERRRLAETRDEFRAEVERIRTDQRAQGQRIEAKLSAQAVFDSDLSRRLDRLLLAQAGQAGHSPAREELADTFADAHSQLEELPEGLRLFLDMFYARLEAQYRGTPEDVERRLRPYVAQVEAAVIRTAGKPVLDLGCGRGEWLHLMKAHDILAAGVDLSPSQLEHARQRDLEVREENALTALEEAADDSLSVITAFHLVEHLAFTDIARIVRESQRVLAPGGLLIFETPNPRNIIVGATSFHNDPTHRRPLTDPVLTVLFETAGYYPVEALFLNPHERLDEFLAKPGFDDELAYLLFGAQDLGLIGQKPKKGA